jgi:multidrug efflux pump subunit AcrA (membrane-fusion protein)
MLSGIRPKVLLFLFCAGMALNQSCKNTPITTEEDLEVITPVRVTPVVFKPVVSTVSLPAVTTFLSKSIMRTTTSGRIEKILVTQGDYVSANQLIFTIRTRESIALGDVAKNDSSLSFKGVINIYSPKEGVISSVSYQMGDYVLEGDELAVLSEENSLVFILDVPYELDQYVERNRRCTLILPDNKEIKGTITGKLAEMNMETQTIRYIIRPDSPGRLPGNLIATVNLIKYVTDQALVLPKNAVLGNETQTEFWIMKLINDSTAVKVDVSKGFESNDEVEIVSPALLATDRIILTGNYGLPDTARISIIKE